VPWLSDPAWAMPSIVLMTLWWTVGGPMVILLAGLKQIPQTYYEAAAIDGATGWRKLIYITLPLLRPVLLFVMVINVIGAFQVFGQTFIITGGGPENATRVLVQYIYETAFNHYRLGYGAAMSWLLFLVIAAFSILQFKVMRDRDGVERGRILGRIVDVVSRVILRR
jgi:multiple sugar transport system permease protein